MHIDLSDLIVEHVHRGLKVLWDRACVANLSPTIYKRIHTIYWNNASSMRIIKSLLYSCSPIVYVCIASGPYIVDSEKILEEVEVREKINNE